MMSRPKRVETTTCLHCGSKCVRKTGLEIYSHPKSRALYGHHNYHVCPVCPDSRVGCHPGTPWPLGFAADKETRAARTELHRQMLDPLWTSVTKGGAPNARNKIYDFLSHVMDLRDPHIGEFTIEQCRAAWLALTGETYKSIVKFLEQKALEE